jgi:CHAT domain-containing protein
MKHEDYNVMPVSVSVSQGDLLYAAYPILIGHFNRDGILYAEKAIDNYLDGELTQRHKLGLYPGIIGSSEVLNGSGQQIKGALITGLGDAGKLTAYQLSRTIEQGITNYLLDLKSKAKQIGISPLIIGCGYGGLSIENSVRAILEGIQQANSKIRKLQGEDAGIVNVVEFVEKYENRALNCYYALNTLAKENDSITLNKKIKTLFGLERRAAPDIADEWWNRINVQLVKGEKDNYLQFSTSTGGAREELRQLFSSIDIITGLVNEISNNNDWSPESAKAIFELLIPNDFKEQLKKQANINWILDKDTAAYPWELLHDGIADNCPLSVSAGMIRQLSTQDYRLTINTVAKKTALVVADPQLKGFLPALPAALKEGELVSGILEKQGFTTAKRIQDSSFNIIKSLFAEDYRIIHLAGHGVFNKDSPEASGMVIGEQVYLSTREIAQMSTVPELVFVNCCFLGKTDGTAEAYYRNRYKLAANIGVQLIENGVKAVVVAGWAVSDDGALDFTEQFYTAMFAGYNFGDAIQKARKYIYDKYPGNNTWGAYQCYGDPFYKLTDISYKAPASLPVYTMPVEAEDALFNLLNRVEMGNKTVEDYLKKLEIISTAVDTAGIRNAGITEKEAVIYAELGEYDKAIVKFETLMKIEKATFSFLAAEQYCNIRSKKQLLDFALYPDKVLELSTALDTVLTDLDSLTRLAGTAERYLLLGGMLKRKALLSSETDRIKILQQAAAYYHKASTISYSTHAVTQWLETESLLVLLDDKDDWTKKTIGDYVRPSHKDAVKELNKLLHSSVPGDDMSYWDLINPLNIKLCLLLIHPENTGDEVLEPAKAGSPGKRLSEREHLQFLSAGLSWSKKEAASQLKAAIDQLIKDWI